MCIRDSMETVGYDMYLRLLSEAISREKGEDVYKRQLQSSLQTCSPRRAPTAC